MDKESANDFRTLAVWQKAHGFVLSVYNYSDYFPQKETLGLTIQFRHAAISIATSIITGFGKDESTRGSAIRAAEELIEKCRYYLILAKDLGYGDHPELMPQLEEISRMLKQYDAADAVSEF